MKKYSKVLAFYNKLLEIISLEGKDLPYETGMAAVELFDAVKDSVSITEFTADHVNALHSDFDVREDYAEAAFKDLAPHLRDPEVQGLVENFFSCSGTADGDDVYTHVKNVRLLGNDSTGPAVVVLVTHAYGNFQALLSKKMGDRPANVHGSYSQKTSKV